MSVLIGIDARLAVNTGSWATPTWEEVPAARDISFPMTQDEYEASGRGDSWKQYLLDPRKDVELTVNFDWDAEDTQLVALRDAWLAGDRVELGIFDGATDVSGTEYFHAEFVIRDWNRDTPMEGKQTGSFVARIAPIATGQEPEIATVA